MANFRLAFGRNLQTVDVGRGKGFSNFEFCARHFASSPVLRRILSLARKHQYTSLEMQEIGESDCALLVEENEALARRRRDFQRSEVRRLLFFKQSDLSQAKELLGYAITKRDFFASDPVSRLHIYEAVVRPPRDQHTNNFLHTARSYEIASIDGVDQVRGVLFAQQNGFTNSCAQVALRTAFACVLPEGDLSYSRINQLAGLELETLKPGERSRCGLDLVQIAKVISGCGYDFVKAVHEPLERNAEASPDAMAQAELNYQQELYGVIESGLPALLGFNTFNKDKKEDNHSKHIVPVFGHTFNEDTWVAPADHRYFGKGLGYYPSETWLSNYVVHDENFGPYYCIPRQHLHEAQSPSLLGLRPRHVKIDAFPIQAIALDFTRKLAGNIENGGLWLKLFAYFAKEGVLVLRTLLLKKEHYLDHLASGVSWLYQASNPKVSEILTKHLPCEFWMVEFSVPELFSSTRHKLGEVLLRCDIPLDTGAPKAHLLACRIPEYVIYYGEESEAIFPSGISSHVPLYHMDSLYIHPSPS